MTGATTEMDVCFFAHVSTTSHFKLITLSSQETYHTHFKRTQKNFSGLCSSLNFVVSSNNWAYLSAGHFQPGEIIKNQSQSFRLYSKRNVAEIFGLIWRDLWALFSPKLCKETPILHLGYIKAEQN